MKKIFKKNQVIATVLAVMIAVAGYLTYANNDKEADQSKKADINPNSEQILANGLSSETGDIQSPEEGMEAALAEGTDTETGSNPGEAVLVNSISAEHVSASVKLNREQVRAKNKETLQAIIDNENLDAAAKEEAVKKLVVLTENIEREAAAENLLAAKGYENSVVTITDDKVDVAVGMASLSDMNRAQIEDIVKRKTGVEAAAIYITPISDTGKAEENKENGEAETEESKQTEVQKETEQTE